MLATLLLFKVRGSRLSLQLATSHDRRRRGCQTWSAAAPSEQTECDSLIGGIVAYLLTHLPTYLARFSNDAATKPMLRSITQPEPTKREPRTLPYVKIRPPRTAKWTCRDKSRHNSRLLSICLSHQYIPPRQPRLPHERIYLAACYPTECQCRSGEASHSLVTACMIYIRKRTEPTFHDAQVLQKLP
ncbi:hypothetical protein GGR51DRAFT_343058 [Nemania sp. FL0031]|nr:hypothetical protein GGR51DRAFT_343058 [Nemania sp. FL0031]